MSYLKEKQKLERNLPEDPAERKKKVRELYELLCLESDAEVLQLKLLGMSAEKIFRMAKAMVKKNVGGMIWKIKK